MAFFTPETYTNDPYAGSSFGGVPYNLFGNQANLNQLYQLPQAQATQANFAGREASQLADPFAPQRGQYKTQLSTLMKNPGEFASSPAYQFAFDQGLQGVNRSLAKGGMLNSGNRLAELTKYGQGLAGQQYFNQAGLLSRLAGAYSGSPAASGQMLMGGFGNAQELERMAAGNRAAVNNPQPYRRNTPQQTSLADLAKQMGVGGSGSTSYSPSSGGSYGASGDSSYSPMTQSYGGNYSFGQPGTYDGPGVGYGTQGGIQTDAYGNVIFGQGTGGDIPTYNYGPMGRPDTLYGGYDPSDPNAMYVDQGGLSDQQIAMGYGGRQYNPDEWANIDWGV